ncbi:hypothetical protein ACYOEI_32610, partial [Singulisphaera rosea]
GDELARALEAAQAELNELKQQRLARLIVRKVRRKLAPSIVGKAWRLSKRVARKGRSYLR